MLAVSVPYGTTRSCVPALWRRVDEEGGCQELRMNRGRVGFGERTVDLLEHLEHPLDVIVVEEPCLGIFVVLLKRHSERVGHIDRLAVILAEEHTDDALRRATRNATRVVVRNGEQDQWMYD
jgi:hypothetical protein